MTHSKEFFDALESMDMDYFIKNHPSVDRDVMTIGLHKARYDCTLISDTARLESLSWLRKKGLGGMYSRPLPKNDELPV